MQLSSQARKAMALGLTASTILMAAAGLVPTVASAAVHSDGCAVLSGGIVWLITGGTRRGFTSAEVFASSGYNFGQVVNATAEDVNLPVGPIMTYADGTLVMDPSLSPLVYLVTNGQKRGFVSGSVFTGLGYSFSNIQTAPNNTFSDLPTGANLDSTAVAHSAGTLVISNGTIWLMTNSGRMGFPSMAVLNSLGLNLKHAVAANSYDLAMPDQGAVGARAACMGGNPSPTPTPTPTSGPVSVSLSGDNPPASTVITSVSQSGGQSTQATADLAHLTFTGSGSVTQLVLQKIGVSANTTLSNVYLYNGNIRITDGASVNGSGQITFASGSGLFNAPASISVKADIAYDAGSGQSLGISFVSGMANGSSIGGSASGNLMNLASLSNLATAVFGTSATNGSGNVNAGSLNYSSWTDTLTVSNRSVLLKAIQFRVVGSAPSDAVQNWALYVDGNSVATAGGLQSINGTNYVVFTPGTPYTLTTGSHTVDVRGDVMKGSSRNFTVSLQNASDVMLVDSSYNVNVTPNKTSASTTFSTISGGEQDVQEGLVTVQADPSFGGTTTIPGGATNVTLGKYNLTAYGEDVQVNNLEVTIADSLDTGVNNVTLYANGAQVGSTKQLAASASTVNFTLGSSLIIGAGQTVPVEIRGDTISAANANLTSGTIQTSLVAGGNNVNNGNGRSSQLSDIEVPASTVTGPTLTVGAGGLTVAKNSGMADQTLSPNTNAVKVGSYVLQAGTAETIRVSNLVVKLMRTDGTTPLTNTGSANTYPALTDFSNLKVSVNGGAASTPVNPQASNNFAQNFTIPISGTATVDVYMDLGNTGGGAVFKTTLDVTATGVTSNTSASQTAVVGQAITLSTGSLAAPTFSTAQSSTSMFIAAGGVGAPDGSHNVYNLVGSSGSVTVSELKFAVKESTAGSISSIKVGSLTAPVITPAATTVASSGSTLATTAATTFNVATGAGARIAVGALLTIESEDLLVTAVSGDAVTVLRGQNSTSAATHADSTAVTINGLADINGLNVAVPNGAGGVYVDAVPTYATVAATGGVGSATTNKVFLTYNKYTAGSSTTSSATTSAIAANGMEMVGSRPNISVTTTASSGLIVGENHAFDLTVTPSTNGPIQLNTIVFNLATTTITVAQGTSSTRLAIGSTTVTGSTCTAVGVSGGSTVTCTLTNYVLTAGTPQTFTLFVTTGGSLGAAGASSLTVSLGASSTFSWTDTAGGGSAVTSANTTYFNNYPSQTWNLHN